MKKKIDIPKQIKITKSRLKNFWYSEQHDNCVGKVFNVTGIWNKNYLVEYLDRNDYYMVAFSDCEVVE